MLKARYKKFYHIDVFFKEAEEFINSLPSPDRLINVMSIKNDMSTNPNRSDMVVVWYWSEV